MHVYHNGDDPNLVNSFDPRVLDTKASKYNADNPNWDMIMGGPFEAVYWSAIQTKLMTL